MGKLGAWHHGSPCPGTGGRRQRRGHYTCALHGRRPADSDALGGHFEVLSSNVAATQLRLVREGRLKALAVSGAERVQALAQVPTLAELGFPQANQVSIFGLFAAGGTPGVLVERINEALSLAWRDPALQAHLIETHDRPLGGDAKAFQQFIADERQAQRDWLATADRR